MRIRTLPALVVTAAAALGVVATAGTPGAAAGAHLDEATRLARTVETWWPAILVALTEA